MTMQFDVKAQHLNATGTVFSQPTRVKGFSICASPSLAGTLVLRDGGAGGTTLLELDIPSNTNPNSFYNLIPGDGIRFSTDVHASLTGIASVTIYYG